MDETGVSLRVMMILPVRMVDVWRAVNSSNSAGSYVGNTSALRRFARTSRSALRNAGGYAPSAHVPPAATETGACFGQ